MTTGATQSNYPAQVIAGESAGSNAAFQPFPYPGTAAAANAALSGIGNEYNAQGANALNSQAQTALNYGSSLPGQLAPVAQQGLTAGTNIYNYLSGLAPGVVGQGEAQYANLAPYVSQALATGFDPQNQLYNQQFALQQQQNQAAQAMAGVGTSPYAVGLTAQGNQNFNIDWQNQQLGRQAQAAQTAAGLSGAAMGGVEGALGTAGALDTQAMNALSSGISDYGNITGLGISGMEGLLGAGGNALSQAEGLQGNQVQQYLQYLAASTGNSYDAIASQLGALGTGTGIYNANTASQNANNQLLTSGLGGIGQFAGGALGGGTLGSLGSQFGAAVNPNNSLGAGGL